MQTGIFGDFSVGRTEITVKYKSTEQWIRFGNRLKIELI